MSLAAFVDGLWSLILRWFPIGFHNKINREGYIHQNNTNVEPSVQMPTSELSEPKLAELVTPENF